MGAPRLTIAIPTYRRPDLLRRALGSVVAARTDDGEDVEVVVSDNSPDDASEHVFDELTGDWPGPSRYHRNEPAVGAIENFNRCIELASGRHLVILHDDDRFLPGGVAAVLEGLREAPAPVMLFGARVEDADERQLKLQSHRARRRVEPRDAVEALVRDSSLIRFPAVAVATDAYADAGGFDPALGGPCDLDMWLRLVRDHGLQVEPAVTVGYQVHEETWTEGMFHESTLDTIAGILDRQARPVLGDDDLRAAAADFYRQFALGGAWRRLRIGDRAGARRRLALLRHPQVRAAGWSPRWAPVELAFRLATVGAGAAARRLADGDGRDETPISGETRGETHG